MVAEQLSHSHNTEVAHSAAEHNQNQAQFYFVARVGICQYLASKKITIIVFLVILLIIGVVVILFSI